MVENGTLEQLDPQALWEALSDHYSDGHGAQTAYQQYATQLRKFFSINRGEPIKTVAGRVVIDISVFLDPYDKANGRATLGFHTGKALAEGLQALASFCRWAEDQAAAEGLQTYMLTLRGNRGAITSREHVTIAPSLDIVTYHSRFEFRFTKELAYKFQLFIANYAEPDESAAA